ncbi:MAG: HAMP domain-containing histidine kinase [Solobacterium sp.]|nr:HAMP domain-containing histidine kinase [Solobacterium sp.]
MKRMRMWLRELTLTQQLLTIIFAFVSFFAGFVLLFLSPKIDEFSETEMYRILHSSQESVIHYLEENPEGSFFVADYEATITQVLYIPAKQSFEIFSGEAIPLVLQEDIQNKLWNSFSGTQDFKLSIQDEEGTHTYLYSITPLKDGRYLIALIADAYRIEFRTSLVNGVVWMNIIIVSLLFVLLMIWVGSLIIPLGLIKNYVNKIRNGDENAVLNVERNDEIGEVANAIRDMYKEIGRENREKQEMIQNISHDLKTPIATIKSYGESIKDGIYPYDTLEKSVDVIIEHADRLEKKVKSLIILNKMGYLLDDCEEGDHLDMNNVIDKVLLSLKVIRPEITFIKKLEEGVCFHGEEEPWRIVVENLIDNALRYARSSVTITLEPRELCVINDGDPIPADSLENIFHPYEKGSNGQFGLGLSIVYRVVNTYGYRVNAENLRQGVCFRIWREATKKEKRKEKNRKA